MKSVPLSLLAALLVLGACDRSRPAPAAVDPGTAAPATVPLKALEGNFHSMDVPASGPLQVWFPAEAMGNEGARAVLTAPVSGLVAAIAVEPGRPVGQGTILLMVRSPELADLKSRWLAATARLKRAQAELAREERLAQAHAGAQRDLEMAQAEQATAQAEAESARIALQARGVAPEQAEGVWVLKAPAAGTVDEWKVRLGQGVSAQQELGSLQLASATLAVVEVSFPVTWKLGSHTTVREGQRTWQGEVVGLPASVGQGTGRLAYRVRLSGGPLPLPGTPLEVQAPVGHGVLLPTSALQQVDGVWGVFLKEGDVAKFHPVKRGPESSRQTLVLEGLEPGAKVITEGAYLLKSKLLRLQSGG
ncbi:MAG: efflux RND transporter periplasmic adaptor subunit, partial [Firmicutes bacterium]|nr:efflux RND transporter periplasmic adaptor subunit [Bacillota bacterium]